VSLNNSVNDVTISAAKWPAAIYVLKISDENEQIITIQKIVKQ